MARGVAVDEEGALVEGELVYLPSDPSNRALSDPDGEFTLAAWSDSETVRVRYHRAGYSTAANLQAGTRNQLGCRPRRASTSCTPGSSPVGW